MNRRRSRFVMCGVIVVAGAACGGGGGDDPDAPAGDPADAAVDAAPDAADEADRVDVTVRARTAEAGPDTTAIAIFADSTGTVVQHGAVDADGNAHAYLPGGGSVTVLQVVAQNDDRAAELTTFRGVEPGDHLHAGGSPAGPVQAGEETYMTAAVTPPANPGGNVPVLLTPCGGGGPNGTPGQFSLTFLDRCVTPTFDLLALADDASLQRYFVWQPGVAYESGGAFTVDSDWAPVATTELEMRNVEANLSRVFAKLWTIVGGRPIEMDRRGVEVPEPGTQSVSLIYPPGAGDAIVIEANEVRGLQIIDSHVRVVPTGTPIGAIDFAALPVPKVTFGPSQTRERVTWTQTGAGEPDARIVFWTGHRDELHRIAWVFIEDPSTPALTELPELPAEYDDYDPALGTILLDGAAVVYVDYDHLDGYDAAREHGQMLAYPELSFLDVAHEAHATRAP
jgi:hypothetical protein